MAGINPEWKLHGYQADFVRRQSRLFGGINGFGTGLGKTFTALTVAQHAHNVGTKKKTLFVVPNAVFSNWYKEAAGNGEKAGVYDADTVSRCLFVGADVGENGFNADAKNYARDLNRILENQHDKVFMTQEAFFKIRLKDETAQAYRAYLQAADKSFAESERNAENEKKESRFANIAALLTGADSKKLSNAPYFEDMGLDDVMFYAKMLAGALGLDLSMLGFADLLSGGLGDGGFFRVSAQGGQRARLIRQGVTGYTDRPNPCQGVKKFPTGKREVYIEDRIYALVYQAADGQIRDLMDVAYLIGQRPVDVVKLHSGHIHNGVLHIRQQKTQAKQRFEIVGRLAEIIGRRLPENGGYLFRNKYGRRLTPAVLRNWFRQLREALSAEHPELADELANFQFRDLRAKSAIYLSSTLTDAKTQLGHTSERMTQTYIRQTKLQRPIDKICGTPPDFAERTS